MSDADMDKGIVRDEFSDKIGRLSHSRAYLDFCEEVYGSRVCLFNMMDQAQLNTLLNAIPIKPDDTILELGCGCGSLLTLLCKKYGCAGIGVDLLSPDAVRLGGTASYLRGSFDDLSFRELSPSIILSVDSLYFSRDLDRLVRNLTENQAAWYFFYSQYLFDEAEDKSALQSGQTRLAQALYRAGAAFQTLDFSENEHSLYINMQKVLSKYENAFALEHNADLYLQKQQEVECGLALFQKGLASRYLYMRGADGLLRI